MKDASLLLIHIPYHGRKCVPIAYIARVWGPLTYFVTVGLRKFLCADMVLLTSLTCVVGTIWTSPLRATPHVSDVGNA